MTFVGHIFMGAAIALLVMPPEFSARRKCATVAAFALLAKVPDLPFPGWGHDRYDISHSVFTITLLLLAIGLTIYFVQPARRWVGGGAIILAGATACYSHLLLDTFYNHGNGLAMFWPFSNARVALPIAWFDVIRTPYPQISLHTLKVYGVEFLAYGPVLLAAALYHRWQMTRQAAH